MERAALLVALVPPAAASWERREAAHTPLSNMGWRGLKVTKVGLWVHFMSPSL